MAQFARPISDISHTGWTQGAGDGNATHFEELDEGIAGADDATTYWLHASATAASGDIVSALTVLTDPVSNVSHVMRHRVKKSATGGKTLDVTLTLGDGISNRSTLVISGFDTATFTTHAQTLSGAEADAIANYAALELDTTATWSGGGAGRTLQVTAQEFECPNASPVRTTKNTRAFPLGMEVGMNWRGAL